MRTTIDLPDELLRRAKARAALDGLKLKELITRSVAQGLEQGTSAEAGVDPAARPRRSAPPVTIPSRNRRLAALGSAEIHAVLDAEDTAEASAGFGQR